MKKSSLSKRLILNTLIAFAAIGVIFAALAWQILSAEVNREAEHEAAQQASQVASRLESIDQLTRAQVDSAMRILEDEGQALGMPSLKGTVDVGGKSLPNLFLGNQSQVMNFTMVDHVKQLAGGTATLFAWDGSNFIRVTTNVMKPDGSRAVGTLLDAKGHAYAALREGRPFDGVIDILGVPYTTSYTPMLDASRNVAGVWYTGFRLDSIATLGKNIAEAGILTHGFVALLKPNGAVVFHGNQVSDEELGRLRQHPDGWVMRETTYPAWGYTILTAYPRADVTARLLRACAMLAAAIVLVFALIASMQFVLLQRSVLRPVCDLTEHLATADLNTMLKIERNDEIGRLAASFNQYVRRLREVLLQVRDSSAATTGKSGEIRIISNSAVSGMAQQRHRAEEAAGAVAQLSRDIVSISTNTQEASGQARLAVEAAHVGGELVTSAVNLIQGISKDTIESAGRIATLTDRAREIGSIVGVIEEIAAGTNLLALNASIEAARAGVHGRGFAVVAAEVRRLAERTAQATKQVAGLVSGIADETRKTAVGIDSACAHATDGADVVANLNSTFDRIAKLVIEVDGRVEEIAQAASREATAATAVSGTMREVAASAESSATGAEQVVSATGELLETAHVLEALVQQFKLIELPQDAAA